MPSQHHHVPGGQRLARVVDLEVAKPQVVEGVELLHSSPLEIAVAHVGVLGPVGHRHLPGRTGEGLTGHREQDTFLNNAQKLVHWKFIDVSELHPLNELTDGAEIYSRVYEEDDADNYIKITQMRAAYLLENSFSNITF